MLTIRLRHPQPATPAAHPDPELVALVEKHIASRVLTGVATRRDADAAYDEMDRIDCADHVDGTRSAAFV
jgi:hypothetical protein